MSNQNEHPNQPDSTGAAESPAPRHSVPVVMDNAKTSNVYPAQEPGTHASGQFHSSGVFDSSDPAAHASGQFRTSGVYDLSDPTALELLIDDDTNKTDLSEKEQNINDARRALLSVEISRQKGVEISGNKAIVPGRVSLTLITLLEILFCVLGFAAGMMHFLIMSPNYALAIIVMSIMLFLQIVIYHSSYRAMRNFMAGLHVFGTIGIMVLCSWAFIDHIMYPPKENMPFFILCVSLFNYLLIPILMLLHFVWLGRGSREIKLKQKPKRKPKKSAANIPTKILKTDVSGTK
ncbi:MAG: hypothetical protein IJU23_15080 [Proteobacteria bacterium]|nr:hypothetical protein [Pseudomonadota bacterium]